MATLTLWQFLHDKLQQQIPCVLFTLLDTQGSTPAKTGAQMVLSADAQQTGSIGGGTLEYQLSKESTQLFTHPVKIQHRHIDSETIGMQCGGQQAIALCYLDKADLIWVKPLLDQLQQHQAVLLAINPDRISIELEQKSVLYDYQNEQNWSYRTYIGKCSHAFIIGGGHVSVALSQILAFLDFHITVIDNRPHLSLLENNHYADVKQTIKNYQTISHYVPEGLQHYVVIMTHSHRCDGIVLEQLFSQQFAYLGLMGSQQKIDFLLAKLAKQGVSAEQLAHLHAPIGLEIGSQNPQEIALSIAAQIVLRKNCLE